LHIEEESTGVESMKNGKCSMINELLATRACMGTHMELKTQSIAKQVGSLVEPILEEMGYELVDVEYVSSFGRWILRLFVDKEEASPSRTVPDH
jgi:hypothetical protein